MFFKLILQANSLEAKKKDLRKEKEISWKEFKNKQTKTRRYGKCCLTLWKKLGDKFKFPKDSYMYKLLFKLRHDGTYENFLIKSIAGFLGGFFLTYIFFMFFVLQLNFKLSTAMIMCSIFGSILTIGLAFSYKVRCIVFLVLPQFFSKKGRQALLAYAYILAITGPAKNTLNNMSILGESLACGQEQLKAAVRQILDVIKKPFLAIRDAIRAVVKAVKKIVVKIKEILLSIKRIILSILKVIKAGFKFLANIMNMCNKEIGTPFQRCKRVFENAITDCNAKLGPLFNWLCNITYLVENVCYIVKLLDYLCIVVDFVKDTVSAVVLKVKQFVRHIRVMFYVRIKFSHSYHFESNHSRSMSEITTGIVTEIKQRSSGLIKIFDFMSSAASMFFIFMVVKVMYYRQKFLTNERFDNKFITKDFRRIDLRRAQLGKETVLPLNHRERQQYVTTSSLRLVKREKSQLSQAAMILLMATLKLSTHMATDYSLYWIMTLIRFYGRFQSKIPAPNVPGLHIEGKGFLASLLRAIVKAFQPIGINLEIDTVPCLPDPIPPDYDRYIQIASLLVLCWFLAIFEPYGLRFRHSVMCFYHPQRARERAIWLYNNILRSRSSFLKFARRQLRRKVKGDSSISKVTLMDFLRAKLNFRVCHWILGTKKQDACLLCGEVFRETDLNKPIKCQTPNCPGLYCERCFSDLQNLCTVCLDPIQYGDLSDISEEKDSSDDERKKLRKKKNQQTKKKKRGSRIKNIDSDNTDSGDDDNDDDDSGKKMLIQKKEKDKDSDYFSSSGNTTTEPDTDYSYSYQDNKDITRMSESQDLKMKFSDVEKQSIPDLASFEEFRRSPSKGTVDLRRNTRDYSITDFDGRKIGNFRSSIPEGFDADLQKTSSDFPSGEFGRSPSETDLRKFGSLSSVEERFGGNQEKAGMFPSFEEDQETSGRLPLYERRFEQNQQKIERSHERDQNQQKFGRSYEKQFKQNQQKFGRSHKKQLEQNQQEFGRSYEKQLEQNQQEFGRSYAKQLEQNQQEFGRSSYEKQLEQNQQEFERSYEKQLEQNQQKFGRSYEKQLKQNQQKFGISYEKQFEQNQQKFRRSPYEKQLEQNQQKFGRSSHEKQLEQNQQKFGRSYEKQFEQNQQKFGRSYKKQLEQNQQKFGRSPYEKQLEQNQQKFGRSYGKQFEQNQQKVGKSSYEKQNQQKFGRPFNKNIQKSTFRKLASRKIPEDGWDSSSSNITELNYHLVTRAQKLSKVNSSPEHTNLTFKANSKVSLVNSDDDNEEEKITSFSTKSSGTYDKKEAAEKLNFELRVNSSDSDSSEISEVEASSKGKGWKRKNRNSKISTESIPLLDFNPEVYNVSYSETKFKKRRKKLTKTRSSGEERAHPDVPKLNLKFLHTSEEDNNLCSGNTCSGISCNCRFFRNSVKYREVSETGRSAEASSSLISEMQQKNEDLVVEDSKYGESSKKAETFVESRREQLFKHDEYFEESGNYDFLTESKNYEPRNIKSNIKYNKDPNFATVENLNVSNIHSASTRIGAFDSPKMLSPDFSSLISSLEHERFSFRPAMDALTVGKMDFPSQYKDAGRFDAETDKIKVDDSSKADRRKVTSKADKSGGNFNFGKLFKSKGNREEIAGKLNEINKITEGIEPSGKSTKCISSKITDEVEVSGKSTKGADRIGVYGKSIGVSKKSTDKNEIGKLPPKEIGVLKQSVEDYNIDRLQKSFNAGIGNRSTARNEQPNFDNRRTLQTEVPSSRIDFRLPSIIEKPETDWSSSTSYPETRIRKRNPNRMISYSYSPDSTITYPFLSSPSKSGNSDFGSEEVLFPIYEDDLGVGNIKAELDLADKLYRAKIREYYRHLKSQQFQGLNSEKSRKKKGGGLMKKLVGLFKSKKKNVIV